MTCSTATYLTTSLKCDKFMKQCRRKMWLVLLVFVFLFFTQYYIVRSVISPNEVPQFYEDRVIDSQRILTRLKSEEKLIGIDAKTLEKIVNEVTSECIVNTKKEVAETAEFKRKTPLYIITPTYRRPEQIAELTRLAQTLMHVDNLHWLLIEDARQTTPQVTELLKKMRMSFDHLVAPMPTSYKLQKGSKPRGVSNRNRGLEWIRANASSGVFYFADDDNTYDIELFEEMRSTKKVSMWPVGLCTKAGLSTPILVNGTFTGFYDGWMAGRKFPVDMASFAVNVKFLLKRPKAKMPYKPGYEEDGFLKSLAPFEPTQIEFKAHNCTRILVWHTQTKKNEHATEIDPEQFKDSNLISLREQIV